MSTTMFQNFDRRRPMLSDQCVCGKTRGQHRHLTQTCPNQRWKIGNGEPQWRTDGTTFQALLRSER